MRIDISQLAACGFTTLSPESHGIPTNLIEAVTNCSPVVMRALRDSKRQVAFSRQGEGDETDIGLVCKRASDGHDNKYFLHHTHELLPCLDATGLGTLVQEHNHSFCMIVELHQALNRLAYVIFGEIMAYLKREHGFILEKLQDDFLRTTEESLSFATTVLRSLWYEKAAESTVAKPHFDRDALTLHLGDQGGGLLAHRHYQTDDEVLSVTPPPGHILVFGGLRLSLLTQGIFHPLFHSAWIDPGVERQSLVQFCNVPQPALACWKAGTRQFRQSLGLDEEAFASWYHERMRVS